MIRHIVICRNIVSIMTTRKIELPCIIIIVIMVVYSYHNNYIFIYDYIIIACNIMHIKWYVMEFKLCYCIYSNIAIMYLEN